MIVLVPHPDRSMEFPREKPKRVLHHLAFRVGAQAYDELEARFKAAGVQVRSGVHPVLKGVRTFYVDDPDGKVRQCSTSGTGLSRAEAGHDASHERSRPYVPETIRPGDARL